MRLRARVLPVIALTLALAGCARVSSLEPDRSGDQAFLKGAQALCAATPALGPNVPAPGGVLHEASVRAGYDNATVLGLVSGIGSLTAVMPSASPLAPTITAVAARLTDASLRYQTVQVAAATGNRHRLRWSAGLAALRVAQARHGFRQLGVSDCPR